jgi:hypothetical protein
MPLREEEEEFSDPADLRVTLCANEWRGVAAVGRGREDGGFRGSKG